VRDCTSQLDDKLCRFRLGLGQRTGVGIDLYGTVLGHAGGLVGSGHDEELLSLKESSTPLGGEKK
jgi:hypothetical protein